MLKCVCVCVEGVYISKQWSINIIKEFVAYFKEKLITDITQRMSDIKQLSKGKRI